MRRMTARGWFALGLAVVLAREAEGGGLPVITSFSPGVGRPGDTVHIFGDGFTVGSLVHFNGQTAARVSVLGVNQLDAMVPTNATKGPVSVTTSYGTAISAEAFVVVTGAGPYIAGFSPGYGRPGDTVIVAGLNFTNAAVRFNGANAVAYVMGTSNQLTLLNAKVPAGASTGPIAVVTPAGTNAAATDFVVLGPGPYITGFFPASGQPGASVTISGLNFTNVNAVRFDGASPTFSVPASTEINAQVPAGATTGPITVATPLGTNTSAAVFVVGSGPVITDFSPTNGVAGSMIVINGANFLGTTAIRFNGTNAAFVFVAAPTQMTAQVPPGATTGPITVATSSGTNSSGQAFTVLQPPEITGLGPLSGPPTTPVDLRGTNFVGVTDVLFGGAGAVFTIDSNTNITATVPSDAGAGPVSVSVVTLAGTAVSSAPFTITVPAAPSISGFSPGGGPVGTDVTVIGSQFVNVTRLAFNGVQAGAKTVSSTQIDTTVPGGATTGPITVTTTVGTATSTTAFVVGPPPQVTGFTPVGGVAGTRVTIAGVNFGGATTVRFNGVQAVFTVNSPSQITAQVPSAAYPGPIAVETPTGTAVTGGDFLVDRVADLAIQEAGLAVPVFFGQNVTNGFVLSNLGPSDATGVHFTAVWPETANVISAEATLGDCSRTTNEVRCSMDLLLAGQGARITVVVVPGVLGSLTNSATLSGNEMDPNPANSTVVGTTLVTAPVLRVRSLAGSSIQLIWPAAAGGFRLQVAGGLSAGVWRDSASTSVLVGTNLVVTNGVMGSANYYRLLWVPP